MRTGAVASANSASCCSRAPEGQCRFHVGLLGVLAEIDAREDALAWVSSSTGPWQLRVSCIFVSVALSVAQLRRCAVELVNLVPCHLHSVLGARPC